jgi:hypothetical protein
MDKNLHIYVSYDEVDNIELSARSDKRWIDEFLRNIGYAAEELMGTSPEIKSVGELASTPIATGDVYILLAILSSQSYGSSLLEQNLELFRETVVNAPVNCKHAVFKILKDPVRYYNQPLLIRDSDPFEFFSERDVLQEDYAKTRGIHTAGYLLQVTYLVDRILQFWKKSDTPLDAPAIYLSNCGKNMFINRHMIKMELLKAGCRVFPDTTYPDDPDQAKDLIVHDINKCILSIHFIGSQAEENLYQSFSLSPMQYQAANSNVDPCFRKLIWTCPETDDMDDQQNSFFELIKRDSENKDNTDILESNLEDLKESIRSIIMNGKKSAYSESESVVSAGKPLVYVIFDYQDRAKGKKLANRFRENNYHVLFSDYKHDFAGSRKLHGENLKSFDVAVVLCGCSDGKWLRMKLMELMKSPGYGRKKPVLIQILKLNSTTEMISEAELDVHIVDDIENVDVDKIIQEASILRAIRNFD